MKKSYLVIIGILVLVLVVVFSYSGTFNQAVALQEGTDEAWSNIQTTYQRRADLIPNLVAVTKEASDSEKEIFTEVTRARSGLPSKEEIADLKTQIANAKTPAQLQQLESVLKSNEKAGQTFLNVAVEAYPNIKSTDLFKNLQFELSGTENRISTARKRYNETIKSYNIYIRGFFTSMILNAEEFPKKEGFQANAGAENAPDVKNLMD
jgi:LemA protein